MKLLTIFLLSVITLFSGTKQTTQSFTQTNNPSDVSIAGSSDTSGQCQAIHINPTDPQAYLPDKHCTPGAINTAVTQADINSTICTKGYTKTIRPPVSYTDKLKYEQIRSYGYPDTNVKDYEEDHFIPLEIGGNPTDPKNLWPEPHPSLNEKDYVEDYLNKKVCNGTMTLSQAQNTITQNWYAIYQQIK